MRVANHLNGNTTENMKVVVSKTFAPANGGRPCLRLRR